MNVSPPGRSERDVHSVSCRACGAAVPIPQGSEVTDCGYCGQRVFIEPNLRRHHDKALEAAAFENEARVALVSALRAESAARARNRVALIGAVVGAPAGIAGAIVEFAGKHLEDRLLFALQLFVLGSMLCALFAGGVAAVAFLNPSAITAKATADLAKFTERLEARQLSSKCPSCGAPLEVSSQTVTFSCSHCQTSLLIASGVAIRFSHDARARGTEWKTEAERALSYADFGHAQRWIVWCALTFIAASGYNALLAVGGALMDRVFG